MTQARANLVAMAYCAAGAPHRKLAANRCAFVQNGASAPSGADSEMNGKRSKLVSLFLLFLALSGCSTAPKGGGESWMGHTESGQASFYADRLVGRKTASGEPYRHGLKTAAHKKLPFGSTVKVTNIDNGKSVVVRVNDRGPFVRDRIIDLSQSAFSGIGDTAAGLINVKIEVVR